MYIEPLYLVLMGLLALGGLMWMMMIRVWVLCLVAGSAYIFFNYF